MKGPLLSRLDLESPAATDAFARALAPHLTPGDTLLLEGPIGAGKTHFARALIRARLSAAGRDEDVPSPTYTLVQTYFDGDVELWHADLYRLTGPDGVAELGLIDARDTAICLVEWPDRLAERDRDDALTLAFAPGPTDDARTLQVFGRAARWSPLLSRAQASAGALDA
jgi:tRNA threonylcarbamoyladenosine biosynthesis protein TsaE